MVFTASSCSRSASRIITIDFISFHTGPCTVAVWPSRDDVYELVFLYDRSDISRALRSRTLPYVVDNREERASTTFAVGKFMVAGSCRKAAPLKRF